MARIGIAVGRVRDPRMGGGFEAVGSALPTCGPQFHRRHSPRGGSLGSPDGFGRGYSSRFGVLMSILTPWLGLGRSVSGGRIRRGGPAIYRGVLRLRRSLAL